jgi:hypothetical protein
MLQIALFRHKVAAARAPLLAYTHIAVAVCIHSPQSRFL